MPTFKFLNRTISYRNEPFFNILFISSIFILAATIFVCSQFPSSYGQPGELQNNTNVTSDKKVGNWTTYTNDMLGISFVYPSDWNVEEKQNRFDSGADVTVSGDDARFVFLKAIDRSEDDPLKPSGIAKSTKMLQDAAAANGDTTVIEPTDVKKYKIGGERTGTFVTKVDDGVAPFGLQNIFVIHNGDGYLLGFRASTENFDEPETQNIMDRIIHSFVFLK